MLPPRRSGSRLRRRSTLGGRPTTAMTTTMRCRPAARGDSPRLALPRALARPCAYARVLMLHVKTRGASASASASASARVRRPTAGPGLYLFVPAPLPRTRQHQGLHPRRRSHSRLHSLGSARLYAARRLRGSAGGLRMLRTRWKGRLQPRGGRGGIEASRGGDPAVLRLSARRGACMPS